MLSDAGITIAGHTISSLQFLAAGGLFLALAAFLLAFSRQRNTKIARSVVTDEVAIQLSRIADYLERIANQHSDRAMWRAARQKAAASGAVVDPETVEPERHVAYSIFGR